MHTGENFNKTKKGTVEMDLKNDEAVGRNYLSIHAPVL